MEEEKGQATELIGFILEAYSNSSAEEKIPLIVSMSRYLEELNPNSPNFQKSLEKGFFGILKNMDYENCLRYYSNGTNLFKSFLLINFPASKMKNIFDDEMSRELFDHLTSLGQNAQYALNCRNIREGYNDPNLNLLKDVLTYMEQMGYLSDEV